MKSLLRFFGPPVITSVVMMIIVRLRWDFASPEEKIDMLPGGASNLVVWTIVLGAIVYQISGMVVCLMLEERR